METTKPYPPGGGSVQWVSTTWLAEHLKDPELTILDVQPNIHDYVQGHIPGAIYVNENLFRIHQHLPNLWLRPEAAQTILRGIGIRADTPVVVYTSPGPLSLCTKFIGDGLEQTMLAYTLARYGHKRVLVLDGGMLKWKEENRPLSQTYPAVRTSDFTVEVQKDFFIGYDEVKAMKDHDEVILIDARPPAFYEGQGPWPKPGHIPGAVSLPWSTLMDDKNKTLMKPGETVGATVKEKGVTPDKTVICSCGTGREATNEFLLFKYYLGYPRVKIYEGSFTEWSSYPSNPVVTGKNPR
jgi:thiosulfate/3-mercaptopyruvate sulfurtransferase